MKYITYYRVSTAKQGKDGNGMKAQQESVSNFLGDDDTIAGSYKEVESGTNGHRPQLAKAIRACKDKKASLLVAKLDRLSRNVAFLFALKDELDQAGVGFAIVNLPEANNTMILGVMATMAQHEAEVISERTKAGIRQSEKWKADQWGNQEGVFAEGARQKAWATTRRNAREAKAWKIAFEFIRHRREQQGMSYGKIAKALNAEGYRTRSTKNRGGKKFYPATVRKVYLRFAENPQ